jgi:hypothetical protein
MREPIRKADEQELYRLWDIYGQRTMWRKVIERGGDQAVAEQELAELPNVTALDALEANARLVDLLTGRRWSVMQAAREAGKTWDEIGLALGMSRQGAQDWYRRKIANQERYVPEFHDAERARAVLDD